MTITKEPVEEAIQKVEEEPVVEEKQNHIKKYINLKKLLSVLIAIWI